MREILLATLATLCLGLFAPALAQQSPPQISSVSLSTARAGDQIVITGSGFGSPQGNGNVWLGSTYGVVVCWSDSQVVATVASGSKTGVAQVLQGGVWSNAVDFTVITPNISSVSPPTAIAGTQVTITGTGFGASQGSGNVWLGSTYGVLVSWSDAQIVANVASGSKSGVAQVLQGGVWSNTVNLTVSTPNITSVTPTTAIAGTQITITGAGFGASQGSGNVWLGSTYGVLASWSDAQIVANVASGSKSGVAQVLQGGVWSNTVNLTVSTPNIGSVTPTTAIAGTQVTITGTGFGANQGGGNVWLGNTYGVVVSWSDTQVMANVASGSSTGVAQVLQGGVWSNTVAFTVSNSSPAPVVSSISPSTEGIGTTVTIAGSYFGNSQGQSSVTFNGVVARIAGWSDGSITARAPSGLNPGTATVNVIVNQLASNGVQFTVTKPLFVTPNQATLLVGQTRPMQLLDENGALINNPTWTSDDSSIAEVLPPANPGDPTLLQADAVGTTTLIASFGDRTGNAKISVLPAGAPLPIGSVQWEIPSLGSYGIRKTVQALRVDENTPDLYVQDDGAHGGNGAIRAFTSEGQQKWIWPSTPSDQSPLLAAADDQAEPSTSPARTPPISSSATATSAVSIRMGSKLGSIRKQIAAKTTPSILTEPSSSSRMFSRTPTRLSSPLWIPPPARLSSPSRCPHPPKPRSEPILPSCLTPLALPTGPTALLELQAHPRRVPWLPTGPSPFPPMGTYISPSPPAPALRMPNLATPARILIIRAFPTG